MYQSPCSALTSVCCGCLFSARCQERAVRGHYYKKYLEKCPKTAVQGNNVFYFTPRQKYKSTDEGMIPIKIHHLQFGCKRVKASVSQF